LAFLRVVDVELVVVVLTAWHKHVVVVVVAAAEAAPTAPKGDLKRGVG
jgi:hypothetical protein